jgi:hypothetical protein
VCAGATKSDKKKKNKFQRGEMRFGGWRGRRNDVQPISFSRTTTQSSYAIKIIQPIEPISFHFIYIFFTLANSIRARLFQIGI